MPFRVSPNEKSPGREVAALPGLGRIIRDQERKLPIIATKKKPGSTGSVTLL
jgi:hypothetical protein